MNFISEPRILLDEYQAWVAPHLNPSSLFLSVVLVRVANPYQFMKAKFEFIDRAIFLRRPGKLTRFPVLSLMEEFLHCHVLIGDYPYNNPRRSIGSLEELILLEFKKSLPRTGDVHIARVTGNSGLPLLYSLKSQGSVEVLLEAMHLPCQ